MPFRPEPKKLELPSKEFIPQDLVEEEREGNTEIDICGDCLCPITCQNFKHCIYESN